MMPAIASFVAALAGLYLISLTMQRHAHVLSNTRLKSGRGKAILRWSGIVGLIGSGTGALYDNPQLGALYWSGYVMVAVVLVTAIQARADR